MNTQDKVAYLDNFEAHYQYDARYLRDLLTTNEAAFDKFNAFMPLSTHRDSLTVEAFWVAKLAAMRAEDCGGCVQLNVRMALEGGVDKNIVSSVLDAGAGLPEVLKLVYDFATSVARNEPLDENIQAEVDSHFSQKEKIEMGLCVAAARVFPTLKRAAGYSKSCQLVQVEV